MPRTTVAAGDLALASLGNDFAQLTYDQPRNGLTNGSFEIWQRGTTALPTATSAANGFTADRWQLSRTSYTAGATADQIAGTGACRYGIRITRTAGTTSTTNIAFYQTLSSADSEVYAGQQVTFSAWVRKGAGYQGNFVMRILSGTGTDQNVVSGFTGSTTVVSVTKTLTTSWVRLSVTGTVSASASQLAVGWYYTPTLNPAVANDYVEFTGAQLEIGATPSTFQMNGGSVAAELANCQRYFQRHGLVSGAFLAIGYGSGTTTTNTFWSISPAMRIAPSSVAYTNVELVDGAGGIIAVTGLALHNPTPTRAIVHATHAIADTAHRPYGLRTTTAAGYVELNAEL
jgi:hypothetical protein